MKKILIIGLLVAAGIGFYRLSPKDQKQVSETGSAAVGAMGKVMGSAWSALRDQAKGLNSDSDVVVLEKTKADLVKVRDDLERKDAKGNKSAIEQINLQIDKLDSAISVKNLKRSMDEKVEAASKLKENSEKMRHGSLLEIAEVMKMLLILQTAKPLSFREKKMLQRARHMLITEVSISRNLREAEAFEVLQRALAKACLTLPVEV